MLLQKQLPWGQIFQGSPMAALVVIDSVVGIPNGCTYRDTPENNNGFLGNHS